MDKTLQTTVALTASRGRGKSAALGLAIAGAIAVGLVYILYIYLSFFKRKKQLFVYLVSCEWINWFPFRYSNIFVTAPSLQNLSSLFEFVQRGLRALKYEVCGRTNSVGINVA